MTASKKRKYFRVSVLAVLVIVGAALVFAAYHARRTLDTAIERASEEWVPPTESYDGELGPLGWIRYAEELDDGRIAVRTSDELFVFDVRD
ncbi:MAG: hypothetical protein ACYTAN_13845 [Planctomycetota bacterium]|jgi:hypothetical protein